MVLFFSFVFMFLALFAVGAIGLDPSAPNFNDWAGGTGVPVEMRKIAPINAVGGQTTLRAIVASKPGAAFSVALKNGLPLPPWVMINAQTGQLSIAPPVEAVGTYILVVTVDTPHDGMAESEVEVMVSVTPLSPTFDVQPVSASAVVGGTAVFGVGVTGNPAPALQWQKSTNGGATWVDIVGATSASYTTPVLVIGDNAAQYRIKATNTEGIAYSNAVSLTVTTGGGGGGACPTPMVQQVLTPATATVGVAYNGSIVVHQATNLNGQLQNLPVGLSAVASHTVAQIGGADVDVLTIAITGTPTQSMNVSAVTGDVTNLCQGGTPTPVSGIGFGGIMVAPVAPVLYQAGATYEPLTIVKDNEIYGTLFWPVVTPNPDVPNCPDPMYYFVFQSGDGLGKADPAKVWAQLYSGQPTFATSHFTGLQTDPTGDSRHLDFKVQTFASPSAYIRVTSTREMQNGEWVNVSTEVVPCPD